MTGRQARAFLARDLRIAASYRSAAILTSVGALVTLTTFHYLGKTVGASPLLASRYGSDYFSFALIGVSVASALRALQTSFSAKLREAQSDGSLESLLAAPLSTLQVVTGLALYPVVNAWLRAVALLVLGELLFGAQLKVNVPAFALTLAVSLAAFTALGLLSAAFVLTFKRGDPLTYLLDAATYLLSGVVYPTEVLPPALRALSRALPTTHALEALRASGLQGAGLDAIGPTLVTLGLFCAVLWPLAGVALAVARRHVERTGTLPHA